MARVRGPDRLRRHAAPRSQACGESRAQASRRGSGQAPAAARGRAAAAGRAANGLPAVAARGSVQGQLHGPRPDRHPGRQADALHRDARAQAPDRVGRGRRRQPARKGQDPLAHGGSRPGRAGRARADAAEEAARRRGEHRHRVQGSLRHGPQGTVPGARRRQRLRLHAVRAERRAARVPVFRRARLQDAVCADAHGAQGRSRALQYAGRQAHGQFRRHRHVHLRQVQAAADLSGGDGCRSLRRARGRQEAGADPARDRQGKGRARQDGARAGAEDPRRAGEVFRPAVSVPEDGHRRRAQLRCWRDGERGLRDVPRGAPAARPRARLGAGATRRARGDGARVFPPVVRRSGHHGVVERPVVERGLCQLDGRQGLRRAPARLRRARAADRREELGDGRGRAGQRAEDSASPSRAPARRSRPSTTSPTSRA